MLTTLLAVSVLAVAPGNVVAVPGDRPLVTPGLINWALREPAIAAAPGTRGIVVQVAPLGMAGIVEVRLFDGVGRVCWLEDAGLVPVATPPAADRVEATAGGSLASGREAREPRRGVEPRKRRRQTQRLRLAAIDAAVGGMMRAVLAEAEASGPAGPLLIDVEVFQPAAFNVPVFGAPVFNTPVFGAPVFGAPVFNTPVF